MEDYALSSGNIFEDMGLANADERLAKAKIAVIINKILEERGLTQNKRAKFLVSINRKYLLSKMAD